MGNPITFTKLNISDNLNIIAKSHLKNLITRTDKEDKQKFRKNVESMLFKDNDSF